MIPWTRTLIGQYKVPQSVAPLLYKIKSGATGATIVAPVWHQNKATTMDLKRFNMTSKWPLIDLSRALICSFYVPKIQVHLLYKSKVCTYVPRSRYNLGTKCSSPQVELSKNI